MKHWPFILIPIIIVVALYLPNLGGSTTAIDWDAYEQILTTHEYLRTASLLFQDFKGRIVTGYYAPLSSVSLMIDKWLIDSAIPNIRFTLLVNLIIHCINGFLLYGLFIQMKFKPWIAGFACLIFLIHPLQVSSVLWFAERKTVLSCTLFLVAFISYLKFRRSSYTGWYATALISAALALISKPTIVILPVILLITELLGLSRADNTMNQSGSFGRAKYPSLKQLRHHIVTLVPFFVLSLIFGIITLWTERTYHSELTYISRPFIASAALSFYAVKSLFPVNLMLVYPRWDISLSNPWWWVPLLGIIISMGLLWRFRTLIYREIWWGLGCFVIPLLPVIGFIRFGYFQHSYVAAHLMYLSMIGVASCIAFAIYKIRSNLRRHGKTVATVLFAVWLGFLCLQTWNQAKLWKHPVKLWTDNLTKCPRCSGVNKMLGLSLLEKGDFEDAVTYLIKALETERDTAGVYMNLGAAYLNLNKSKLASDSFNKAVKIKPKYARGHANLGLALLKKGKFPDSIYHLKKAIKLDPDLALAYQNLGTAFEIQGDQQRAIENYKLALQKNPSLFTAHNRLGLLFIKSGKDALALDHFMQAIVVSPNHYESQANVGLILLKRGKPQQATPYLEAALRIRPQYAVANNNLGRSYELTGRLQVASRLYQRAAKLSPDSAEIQYNLANVLVKLNQPEVALQHYARCTELDPKHYRAYSNRGAALMMLGRLKDASEYFRKALEIQPDFQQAKTNLDIATKALKQYSN